MFEGTDLIDLARSNGDVAPEADVRANIWQDWQLVPSSVTVAYYQGAYHHVVHWDDDRYSVLDGWGRQLTELDVDRLREPLAARLRGHLVVTAEEQAKAERRHAARLNIINRLMRDEAVDITQIRADSDLVGFEDEPFLQSEGASLTLRPAASLTAEGTARFFNFLFEQRFMPWQLAYMLTPRFRTFVARLVQAVPDLQGGFAVPEDEQETLEVLAPLFPSVCLRLANANAMITTHRQDEGEIEDPAVLEADRVSFWQALHNAIRSDYAHPGMRGFLYDHLGIAELEEQNALQVKGKSGPIGRAVETVSRRAVRQYTDGTTEQANPVYIMVQLLPGVAEPWVDEHPDPRFSLSSSTSAEPG